MGAAKLLVIDRRVACGVLGGIGDGLADLAWKMSFGVGKLAVEFEEQARAPPAPKKKKGRAVVDSASLLAFAGVQRGQSVTPAEELATIVAPVLCINGQNDDENGSKEQL